MLAVVNLSSPLQKINAVALLGCCSSCAMPLRWLSVHPARAFGMTALLFLIPLAFSLGKSRSKCLKLSLFYFFFFLIYLNVKDLAALWMGSCSVPVRCLSGTGVGVTWYAPANRIGGFWGVSRAALPSPQPCRGHSCPSHLPGPPFSGY